MTTLGRVVVSHACMLKSDCLKKYHWTLDGTSCEELKIVEAVPDVFFLSLILFIGTFTLAIFFRIMRTSRYFPSVVSSTVNISQSSDNALKMISRLLRKTSSFHEQSSSSSSSRPSNSVTRSNAQCNLAMANSPTIVRFSWIGYSQDQSLFGNLYNIYSHLGLLNFLPVGHLGTEIRLGVISLLGHLGWR